MRTVKYTFWQEGGFFLGYLNEYPDYCTQGYSKDELLENLKDLLTDLNNRSRFLVTMKSTKILQNQSSGN